MKQKRKPIEEKYKKEFIRRNCANFQTFAFGGMVITAVILLFGILRGEHSLFNPQYGFFFIYMAALYGVSRICSRYQTNFITEIYYIGLLPVYIGAILMGTVFDPGRPAITIMVLLCGMTLFILDNSWRLSLYIISIMTGFTVLSYITKSASAFSIDLINIVIFGMIALAINYASLRDRMESVKNYLMIQESRKQKEMIISNLPTGIIVLKVENGIYSIVQVNPVICKMIAMDEESALKIRGEQILMMVHQDDKEIVNDATVKLAVPGTEVHYEFRNLNRITNTYSWTAADGKSVLQPDGSILVYIGYADINARKEKEEEYRRRLNALTEMEDENLIAKGQHNLTQNKVIFFSAKKEYSAKVINGNSYEEAVQALVDVATIEKQKEKLRLDTGREALLKNFGEGHTDGSIKFRRLREDGQIMWTMLRYALFEEPNTKDVIAFMHSYDVTERVMEQKIVSKIGNMEYDLFGLLTLRTKHYSLLNKLNHMDQNTLIAEGDFDTMAQIRIVKNVAEGESEEVLRAITVKNIKEQLKSKEIFSIIYTIVQEDGRKLRKRFQFTYLDETKEMIMFFRSDITELYEKEQEQLRKIEAALKEAEIASSAKTEFFSRMSHDMRTPMNGILGLSNLSREEKNPEVLKENILKIEESGQYLLGLINDTLDFQRIESGKLTLEPKPVKTTEIVQNIVDMVKQTAESKGVTLVVSKENIDVECYIKVDALRMKQIFVNLLSNAIKFTPTGGTVEFSMKLLSCQEKISHDLFIVRDTGIGMTQEFLQERIFKPFSQESNYITSQYAGSGLGLSIAKSLVEMMGGTIEVESELGVGTTFTIHLDFERINSQDVQQSSYNKKEHIRDVYNKLKGKSILLVEDHPLNAEIAKKLIEKAGCRVDWLKNGLEAVEYFENPKDKFYDLVLMDIRMPVMDGLEAVRRIRALENDYAKKIPIIAMTANAYEEDIKQSKTAGMNEHLAKPIEPEKLFDVLVQYLVV